MAKNKRILYFAITASVLLAAMALSVVAYFSAVKNVDKGYNVSSRDSVVEISSFYDLYSFAKASEYNSQSGVSSSSDRKTLRLTADITLESDVFITADCHIDLNGKSLLLNGNTLTVTHSYHGSNVIFGGSVYPNSRSFEDHTGAVIPEKGGRIVFDTPNSETVIDSVSYFGNDGTSISESAVVRVLWQTDGDAADEKYSVYNALYTLASAVVDEYDNRPDRLTFDEVASLGELDLSSVLFSKRSCEIGGTEEICAMTFRDLDLPTEYNNGKATLEYSVSSPYISSGGNVNVPEVVESAALSVTVTSGGTSVSDTLTVHIYNHNNADAKGIVAKNAILARLSPFYSESAGRYVFNRGIHLPASLLDVTFEYSIYSDEAGTTELRDAVSYLVDGDYYLVNLEPTVDSKLLRIKIMLGNYEVETLDLLMKSENTGIIVTNASIAKSVIESWYENSKIVVSPKSYGDLGNITEYTYQDLRLDVDQFGSRYGIVGIEYELMNDSHGIYEIINASHVDFGAIKRLKVVSGKHPGDYVEDVFVNCKFAFDDGTTEQIQIPVVYNGTLSGDNVNEFLPYYTYYNELLYSNYAGATYTDFEIPFCYGNFGPIICYDTAVFAADGSYERACPDFMSVALYYNGSERVTFDYDGKTKLTRELLDEYLSENGLTLQTIIGYGDAKWIFKLDSGKMPSSNTEIGLIYNYKMSADASGWTTYPDFDDPDFSKIIILGVLHLGTDVPSEELYAWIFNKFNISDETYSSGSLVVSDWLKQNISVDYKNDQSFPKSENLSFKGLEFLVGTKYLDLSSHPALKKESIAAVAAVAISEMVSLETLKLSDCAFTDRTGDTWDDNGTVSKFANLVNLRYFYINGNNIYNFEWLNPIATLEQVYTYGNITSGFESVFYGSEGLVNLQVFTDLTDRGVMVYSKKTGDNVILFEENNDVNDYVRLSSIEYQRKLESGVDISALYSEFSTNSADYNLSTSYTYLNANGTSQTASGVRHSLEFGYEGDAAKTDLFTLTDTITYGNTEVTVVVKFKVVRY